MHRKPLYLVTLLAVVLCSANAFAGIWFELKEAPCLTGNPDAIVQNDGVYGRYKGAIDCFNRDFNGGGARTTLTLKGFQAWEYGTVFFYYDITGPWNSPAHSVISPNELAGFFGGITVAVSAKKIYTKATGRSLETGLLADLSVKYEMEHVSKFGMLHYYGLQWDLAIPFLDFLTLTSVIRYDPSFEGIDLQLGGAWRKTIPLGNQNFVFTGFLQWGVFGQGAGKGLNAGFHGGPFLYTKPQLLWDLGKAISFTPDKVLVGFEYQFSLNRYLIPNKTENTLQVMARWNI